MTEAKRGTRAPNWVLGLGLMVLSWAPVLIHAGAVGEVAALHHLALAPNPYIVAEHAVLLYVISPLVVLSACMLLLSPGMLLSLALGAGRSVPEWLLTGLALSLIVVSVAAGVVQAAAGATLQGSAFAAVVAACALVSAVAWRLSGRRRPLPNPFDEPNAVPTLAIAFGLALALVVVMAPKFYWENFNGDGYHGYETVRLLLRQPLPFWPPSAGGLSHFPGMKTVLFAFPSSWFLRLFGEWEASARLPACLMMIGLYAGLLGLIDFGRREPSPLAVRILVALSLGLFALILAYSATEDMSYSDLALPGVGDTLFMALFCGFALNFLRKSIGWTALFAAGAYMASPNALPLIGAWLLGALLFLRPLPISRVAAVAGVLVAMILFDMASPAVFAALNLPAPGVEHGTADLVRRATHVQVRQVIRFAWAFVPTGILPAFALLAWRWQDQTAKTFTVAVLILFAFYYVQDHLALHYFVPVMVLPLVVLWRLRPMEEARSLRLAVAGSAVTLAVAFFLSWPSTAALNMASRVVGESLEDRTEGYRRNDYARYDKLAILQALFPSTTDVRVPSQIYGGHPTVWEFYSARSAVPASQRNYVLQYATAPAVPGARLVATRSGLALYVRSAPVWAAHARQKMPETAGSRLYFIPAGTLFAP